MTPDPKFEEMAEMYFEVNLDREYSADLASFLAGAIWAHALSQARIEELEAVLTALMPAAVWFFEGPYGSSPDPDSLQHARKVLGGEE